MGVDCYGSVLAMPQSLNNRKEKYLVEGIGKDYVPKCLDRDIIDDWIKVSDKDTMPMTRRIIKEEGLFCGGSAGATMFAAI